MKIYVGEAFIEREKRVLMHVVTVSPERVELAYKPNGTIAVTTSREDFERFWMPAPKYHTTSHPWRRQRFGKTS